MPTKGANQLTINLGYRTGRIQERMPRSINKGLQARWGLLSGRAAERVFDGHPQGKLDVQTSVFLG